MLLLQCRGNELKSVVKLLELRLGVKWEKGLRELTGGGIYLAIYPANKPGDVIVLRDAITQQQLLSALEQAGPSLGLTPEKHQVSSTTIPTDTNN